MKKGFREQSELTDDQFDEISDFVKDLCGINLHEGKKELVKARLGKRMRALGMIGFDQYMEHVRNDVSNAELTAMLDAISTNLTFFFREIQHFDYLRNTALPKILERNRAKKRLRIWSSGCSTGEEPYSIAMLLSENVHDLSLWDAAVLATDLSTKVLATAAEGSYSHERLKDVSQQLIGRYFTVQGTRDAKIYKVSSALRRLVHFGRLNLMEDWPMKGPFDVIFCRNVMIYFDKETQSELVNRYYNLLSPGGWLFIGHSESLTGIKHQYKYIQPAIYQKP